jgi:phosphoribosylformylglycinamidine synthase subunit PurS
MARVVVEVMPKPEILDPQGKAVTGALARLGFAGMSVRQGKRFELEVEGELTDERLAEVRRAAETLLANTVIESFSVRIETEPESPIEDQDAEEGQASEQDEAGEQAKPAQQADAGEQAKPADQADAGEQAELATQAG